MTRATRPDIAFSVSMLRRFCSNPEPTHWRLAKRTLRYLKETSNYGITYECGKKNLQGFTDSDWAGDVNDRKSCTGNVIMLAGGPISWKSQKQRSVALSTMEAEYVSTLR